MRSGAFYAADIVNGKKWLYTVVPKNFRYPTEMPKQILQEIYMQGETMLSGASAASGPSTRIIGGGSTGSSQIDDSLYDAVLNLSMKNAGIDTDDGPSTASGWTPSACILYEDDLTHEKLPLKNVTVRVNTFVNIGTGQTDERGYVAIPEGWGGKFRNRVDYEVKFKTTGSKYWNTIRERLSHTVRKIPKVNGYIQSPAMINGYRLSLRYIGQHTICFMFRTLLRGRLQMGNIE